jgi:hypothetical protein
MISINLNASEDASTNLSKNLKTNLELPKLEMEIEDADDPSIIWQCRKAPAEKTILEIYLGYKTCAVNKPLLLEALELDRQMFLGDDYAIELYEYSLELQEEFGENMYELIEAKESELREIRREAKLSNILVGVTAGVVGLILGVGVGFLAF